MAPHDFVRTSVARQLNVVLRDEEMIGRSELEANMMYHRAREIGVPLEQVTAVMLHIDDRWQSGLAIYREKRRPFSERERAALQSVTPAIANAVRNCHQFGAAADWSAALEALGEGIVLLAPPAIEVSRTPRAAQLIDKWFAPHERRAGRVPEALLAVVAQGAPATWTKRSDEATLEVSVVPLSGCMGKARWMFRLREQPHAIPTPPAWRALLTRREQEVISAILRGWDNRLICEELGCSEATVKVHNKNIFDKLGVQSRTALVARAAEYRG
jgi:DNA-binding CsgD family transcriptional regulator